MDENESVQEQESACDEYSLELKEYHFKIKDKNGTVHPYFLRELEGTQRGKFLNESGRHMKIVKGVPVPTDFAVEPSIIAMHCFDEATGRLVHKSVIISWPSSLLNTLARKCMQLSGLGTANAEKAEEEAKNV